MGGTPGAAGSSTGGGGTSGSLGGAGGEATAMGGSGGMDGSAGASNSDDMDTPPLRPLMVDTGAGNVRINFTATQLDPMAGTSGTPTHADAQQFGTVNKQSNLQGKLVMTLGGIGGCCGQGGIGGFAEGLGFHHMGIAMQTAISSAPDNPYRNTPEGERTDEDNRQMGDARMEAWDGTDRVDWLDINRSDSFERRAELGIAYMQAQDPAGDWEYFLDANGGVRWSDVYLVGYSYGSQTLAVVSKYVRIGRGIATSGPASEGFPNATWIHEPSVTPLDRMYVLVGESDIGDKVETVQSAGWLGDPVNVPQGADAAAIGDGHILILLGQGHGEFCAGDGGGSRAVCLHAFGVSEE
jgi:hypothetical protein